MNNTSLDREWELKMPLTKTQTHFFAPNAPAQKSKRQPKARANELDGKRWLQHSISVWNDIKRTPDEKKRSHPAMFPVQLVTRLLESFTNSEQRVVLDPFLGSGTTLIAAQMLGKSGVGIEISQKYVEISLQRLSGQLDSFRPDGIDPRVIHGNAADLPKYAPKESMDICITSPPYWDILSQPRSADGKAVRDYEPEPGNLGHEKNYVRFLRGLRQVFEAVFVTLKPGSYCIINVMDIRKKNKLYPLHIDLTADMGAIGFELDDIIIWDRRSEYNDLRPLGYPSVFRLNRIHEYLLIFRKPRRHDR